jgi:hypothetical protein
LWALADVADVIGEMAEVADQGAITGATRSLDERDLKIGLTTLTSEICMPTIKVPEK